MKAFISANKLITALAWLWAIAGALGLPVPYAQMGMTVLVALVSIHLVELAFFLPRLQSVADAVVRHVVGVLIFGVFYYMGARATAP